ncbi:hypothetical protein LJK87_30030 [Paenibacillus sp. P25]|nr:hypothetical protein LJK87_30030 [Paenibacillus sp. P25]
MRVRGDLFAHWEKLSAQYFNNRRIGDLMSHAISDVGVIREVTMQGYFNVMEAVFLIAVSVASHGTDGESVADARDDACRFRR